MNEFEPIKQWLLAAYRIKVSDEWLAACLEWIQQECQSQGEGLKQLVYEQWLLSDLAEIGEAILPSGIGAAEKVELTSDYPLQLLSSLDVGFPFYGQSQKLQGRDNPNAGVSADQPLQPAWEPKPTSTLLLELSDGHTSLQALEVETLPCLHTELPSGTKMYLRGPLLCRRGVLLLRKDSVKVLGGEVDALIEANKPLATLQRHMEQNRQDEGKHAKREFSGQFLYRASSDSKGDLKQKVQSINGTNFSNGGGHSKFSQNRNFPVKQEVKSYTRNSEVIVKSEDSVMSQKSFLQSRNDEPVQSMGVGSVNQQSVSDIDQFVDDFGTEWDEDLDYNELFKEEMEAEEIDPEPSRPQQELKTDTKISLSCMQTSSIQTKPIHSQLGKASHHLPVSAKVESTQEEDYFDDDLELLDIDIPFSEVPQISSVNSANCEKETTSQFPKSYNISSIETCIQHPQKSNSSSPSWSQMNTDKNFQPHLLERKPTTSKSSSHFISFQAQSSVSQPNKVMPIFKGQQQQQVQARSMSSALMQGSSDSTSVKAKATKQSKLSDMFTKTSYQNKKGIRSDPMNGADLISKDHDQTQCSPSPLTWLRPVAQGGIVGGDLSSECRPSHANPPKAVIHPFQGNLDLPFQYLCQVQSNQPRTTIMIKAYISTLTDKLNCSGGSNWSLSCKINDGTASMDVDIDNIVLTDLIGFTAQESVLMRQEMNVNPQVKEKLMKGLQSCQQKLANMSCLMELELTTGRPVVRKLSPIARQHVLQLMARLGTH